MELTATDRVAYPFLGVPPPRSPREHLQHWADLWWAGGTPDWGPAYTAAEQRAAEARVEQLLATATAELQCPPRTEGERQAVQERLLEALGLFVGPTLGLDRRSLDVVVRRGLIEMATEFVQMARRFDPGVSADYIYQASRNVWTMGFLQLMLGLPVQMTPAVFAYSMLYPYTDNYLDDPAIPRVTKRAFNERFRRRLEGEDVAPANARERTICELVALIEDQFERSRYPQVYESLLAIYHAQIESLALLRRNASPYEVDVVGITFAKGGASVLADGYLVAGSLTDAQAELMFGYGAFTQLMDDLEDVEQDRRQGLQTIFAQTAGRWPLDGVTSRTIRLGARVLGCLDGFQAPDLEPLRELMRRCINPLLYATAGRAGRLYTRAYLRELEAHSPCRFSFLKRLERRLQRQRLSLSSLIERFATLPGVAH